MELLKQQQQNEFFSLDKAVINTERGQATTAQVIVNFFTICIKILALTVARHIAVGTLNDVRMLAGHFSLATTQRYIAYNTEAQRKICGDELEKVKVFLESRL